MAESLAELYPAVIWKEEFVSTELGYLAEEISRQSIEDMAWFREEIN
jgi:hypothetical protein